jgi:cysteine synthase A
MQGWTPDFIPKIAGDVDLARVHKILPIAGPDALRCSQELAAREGIFVGITSGATFAGALAIAREAPRGANVLCLLPDTGERYLSTPLFASVPADMTEEEAEIFRSTPFGQKAA